MKSAPIRHALVGMALAAVTLAACGSDATTESSPTASISQTPAATASAATSGPSEAASDAAAAGDLTVVDSVGEQVTLDAPATAIVSLSPTATESLFAIGAGDQVVAVDEYSYFPDEAPVTDLSGFTPNAEAVAAHEPDLVVIQNDANDLVAQLDALDIPTLQQAPATSFDDVYAQIAALGVLTGQDDGATVLVEQMQTDIDKVVADAPADAAGMTYFHEISTDYYTTSSAGFIGQVYGLFDLVNIADEAAEEAGTEFPQMSEEAILAADPQLVYTTSGATADDVAARPGWADVAAVTNDAVVMLPEDVPSRWGPRVVEFVEAIAASLDGVGATQ